MNKAKLKYLPFSLLWCLTTLIGAFVVLSFVSIDLKLNIVLSLILYFNDVEKQCTYDELDERLKSLVK